MEKDKGNDIFGLDPHPDLVKGAEEIVGGVVLPPPSKQIACVVVQEMDDNSKRVLDVVYEDNKVANERRKDKTGLQQILLKIPF